MSAASFPFRVIIGNAHRVGMSGVIQCDAGREPDRGKTVSRLMVDDREPEHVPP